MFNKILFFCQEIFLKEIFLKKRSLSIS
jgi:hypothetical protein